MAILFDQALLNNAIFGMENIVTIQDRPWIPIG